MNASILALCVDFRDSWKHEVAAYELDKLLGLNLVPPTVERRIDGRVGSLQLWVEEATTEEDRSKRKLQPPHLPRWKNQLHNVRLFHQLTYNTDFQNIRNARRRGLPRLRDRQLAPLPRGARAGR